MKDRVYFEGLDDEATICAYCGYCRSVCPTYAIVGWESCSPRGRIQLTRMLLGKVRLSAGQMSRLYQCTLCGRCNLVCSTRIDLRRFWLEARDRTVARLLSPPGLFAARDNISQTGNIYGYPNEERAGWVEYMDDAPPDLFRRDRADAVYFVGCSSSFSPRAQSIAESFARLMSAAGVSFTIWGDDEVCCGFPLLVAGMRDQAEALIERNLERFRATGATTAIFTCPSCRMMWLEKYAPRLPDVRMLHSTELLDEAIAAGQLRFRGLSRIVTYHDPCDLARNGGVFDPPRRLLSMIPDLKLLETYERRERGLCCGGGGDLEIVDPKLVESVAAETAKKLAAIGAEAIVTACPQCLRTLIKGVETSALKVDVLDIVELLASVLDNQ